MARFTPFQIFYTSVFSLLNIGLIALLIITPADAIRQCLSNDQVYNAFVIAGSYVLTIALSGLIYASRLYTTRSILAAIPKTWVPVEKGDVSKSVRAMIVAGLARSAAISWDARPHAEPQVSTVVSGAEARMPLARPAEQGEEESRKRGEQAATASIGDHIVVIPHSEPTWIGIAHDGWGSTASSDLPDLEYNTVILELSHLIEARAVSLAPPDPDLSTEPPTPDLRAIELLQRPMSTGLRDYITHLTSLGVIPETSSTLLTTFLSIYEYARFSTKPLSENQFRDLMKKFAEILHIMQPLSPQIIASLDSSTQSDIDTYGSSSSTPTIPYSRSFASSSHSVITRNISRSDSGSTIQTAPSRGQHGHGNAREFTTAPGSPMRSRKRPSISRTMSVNSFAQTSAPYLDVGISNASSESLKSSTTQGSVIKSSSRRDQTNSIGGQKELGSD